MTRWLAATLIVLAAAACSGDLSEAPPAAAPPAAPGAVDRQVPQAPEVRKLSYSADVVLRAGDPWAVADRARAIAADLGGDVLSIEQSGETDSRSARLSMRVPATRFEEALARLRELDAEVASSRISTRDVTEEFVDLEARLASKKREEEQYLSLLSQARTVDDTLKVSQALASVRTEIEQLTGQLNALTGRVEYSTINVTIDNVADLRSQSAWQPARTAAEALVALVGLLKFLGDLVIWLVLVGWVPAVLVVLFLRLRAAYRRRFGRTPPTTPAPATPAAPGPIA